MRKSERIDWNKLVPVGVDGRKEKRQLLWLLAGSTAWSLLWFLSRYFSRLQYVLNLLAYATQKDVRRMPHFAEFLAGSMIGFQITAAVMLLLAVTHYLEHYREGRSIYLMRRLPDGWDLWRRCLAVPLLGLAGCATLSLTLLLAYFAVYRLMTPAGQCDPPALQEPLYHLLCWLFRQM